MIIKMRRHKIFLTIFILFISLILFISVFTRFYSPELRYIYHLFYGFGGCVSTYFIFYFIIRIIGRCSRDIQKKEFLNRFSFKWEWLFYLIPFLLVVGFDVYWQFFNSNFYNSDSA